MAVRLPRRRRGGLIFFCSATRCVFFKGDIYVRGIPQLNFLIFWGSGSVRRNFERTGALPLYLLKPPHFGSFSNRFQPNFSELVRRSALPRFQPELLKSLPPLSPIFSDQSGHTPTGATRADTRGPDHQSRHAPTSAPERTHAHQGTKAATRPPAHQSGHTRTEAPKPDAPEC